MKTLYILRHAEAASDKGGGDFDRSLTDNGAAHAETLGAIMKERNFVPVFAACSSARRTRQTLEGVLESISIAKVDYSRDIYHATTADLLAFIQGLDDAFDSVLIVGHNPVMHEICVRLSSDEAPKLLDRLTAGYKPGTLSVFSCPCATWRDLRTGENKIIDVI